MFIVKNINAFVTVIVIETNQIPKTYNYGYQPEQIKCNFKEK